jgi:hypothetical protein
MNIHYQLTVNEYQNAVALHHKTGRRPILISLYAGLSTFIILVGTDFSNTREVITNILVAFFAISFYILFVRIITAYQAKSIYKKSNILSKEVTLHISGKGIKENKKDNDKTLPWSMFTKWKKNENFYLIYAGSRHFNVIPLRAMKESQIKELDTYLEKYITQK